MTKYKNVKVGEFFCVPRLWWPMYLKTLDGPIIVGVAHPENIPATSHFSINEQIGKEVNMSPDELVDRDLLINEMKDHRNWTN